MSILSNHINIEAAINYRRIKQGLRILWPDYEIYDLLSQDMTVFEIMVQATFPPQIVHIESEEEIRDVEHIMKDYTHKINEKLQVYKGYTLFLNKRNIAVDSIANRFSRGKYVVTVQVAQLSRQFSLWGMQALSQSLKTIGPKYISKRKTSWILEYEFDQNIKAMVIFSTRRQPCYGKNQNHFDLPRDAIKQSYLKMRQYPSVMEYYLHRQGEESLLGFNSKVPQIAFKKLMISKKLGESDEEQNQKEARQLLEMKCKINESLESREPKHSLKYVKIRQVKSQTLLAFDIQNNVNLQLKQLCYKVVNTMPKLLINSDEGNQGNFGNLQQLQAYQQMNQLQKLHLLQKQPPPISNHIHGYLLIGFMLQIAKQILQQQNSQISRNMWIRLYSLLITLDREDAATIFKEILQKILIIHARQLLKNSQDELQKMEEIMGKELHTCLLQALQLHLDNEMLFSDILLTLMKVQKAQNLVQLFKKYPLKKSSVLLTSSLSGDLSKLELPCNDKQDLIYEHNFQFDYITYQQSDVSKGQQKKGAKQLKNKRYHIEVDRFSNLSLLVSKTICFSNKQFKVFLYKQGADIFCFVQYLGVYCSIKNKKSFQSFEVVIQLTINQKQHKSHFGWNFTLPSQSVGCKFQGQQDQINYLSCVVYMNPQIVHQCILNYMSIRYVELFKFPYEISEIQSKQNIQNQRLSKRRSTFELQNLFSENSEDALLQTCYFHKKCEQCVYIEQNQTVFTIDQIDMFSLLLAINFKKQVHALMCLGKYLLFKKMETQNLNFMEQCLRLSYLPLSDLLDYYNRHTCVYSLASFLKALIETKLKNAVRMIPEERDGQLLIFAKKARTMGQMLFHIQKDFSNQLLVYLKGAK